MLLFIESVIVGICAILPGVSGSTIAISFGIYEKIIQLLTGKINIKNNLLYFITVFIGFFIGFFLTGNIIIYIFKYKSIIYYCLIGIILSEIPFLIKKIHNYNGQKVKLLPFLFSLLISLLLELLSSSNHSVSTSITKMFVGGILFSFGKVFPGVSSSFFLLCLGIYDEIIILFTKPILIIIKFYYYLPFIIGTLFGLILFLKIINFLLNKYYELVYSMILGFVTSSIIIIYPKQEPFVQNIIGIILIMLFFSIFIYIKRKNDS